MSVIDLSTLTAPAIVETLDYEAILASLKSDLIARAPDLAPVLALESEPLTKLLEVAAWREMVLRARINDAARAVMLPWATGTDLDNIAARYDLVRLPDEDDERFRRRVLIGYHALSAAGSAASWKMRALSVSTDIRQVDVWADRPGRVKVCLLARVEEYADTLTQEQIAIGRSLFGTHPLSTASMPRAWRVAVPSDAIVSRVATALLAEDVRPLSVEVDVSCATVLPVEVSATLIHPPGQDGAFLAEQARTRMLNLAKQASFRVDMTRAQIIATLMGDGMRDVILHSPTNDVIASEGDIPAVVTINLTTEARRD